MNSVEKSIRLTQEQEQAFALIREWFVHLDAQIFVLCGYAGTGKTFLLEYAVRELGLEPGKSAVFVAPTGKAASVLLRAGVPAGTIHSLIYRREEDIEVNEDGEVISERFLRFVKRESIEKDIRLIIVDETSMVSDEVLRDLLSFGVKCLFSGDPAQLPPVEGSNTLLTMPCVTLTHIVRQEEGAIVRLAEAVRAGKTLPFGRIGEDACVLSQRAISAAERRQLLMEADQIIVGTNRTRMRVNEEMRGYLGFPAAEQLPCEGEKLICTLNNWSRTLDHRGMFHLVNGIIGTCFRPQAQPDGLGSLDFQADFLQDVVFSLPFDAGIFSNGRYVHGYGERAYLIEGDRYVHENNVYRLRTARVKREEMINRFEFAYAITCHKAQGSEYDYVVVFDESRFFPDPASWLYTAITRARKRLVILR